MFPRRDQDNPNDISRGYFLKLKKEPFRATDDTLPIISKLVLIGNISTDALFNLILKYIKSISLIIYKIHFWCLHKIKLHIFVMCKKFSPAMKSQYCGFSQINGADTGLFDSIVVQSVTARDKILQLASVWVCSVSTQDIPGAVLCDV